MIVSRFLLDLQGLRQRDAGGPGAGQTDALDTAPYLTSYYSVGAAGTTAESYAARTRTDRIARVEAGAAGAWGRGGDGAATGDAECTGAATIATATTTTAITSTSGIATVDAREGADERAP